MSLKMREVQSMKKVLMVAIVVAMLAVAGCGAQANGEILTDPSEYCLYVGEQMVVDPASEEYLGKSIFHAVYKLDGSVSTGIVKGDDIQELDGVLVNTKRGIQLGDSVRDVINAYGDCAVVVYADVEALNRENVQLQQYAVETNLEESNVGVAICISHETMGLNFTIENGVVERVNVKEEYQGHRA